MSCPIRAHPHRHASVAPTRNCCTGYAGILSGMSALGSRVEPRWMKGANDTVPPESYGGT